MKTKTVFLNFITDIIPKIVTCILGIIKARLFLQILGQEQLGVFQLDGQILSYLVLAEGGIGTAVLYRLNKSISQKDIKKTNELMATSKIIFRVITTIMLVVGLVLMFCVPLLIKDFSGSTLFLYSTFFIYLITEILAYLSVPEKSRFDAEQKKYIVNLVLQCAQLGRVVLEIIIILVSKNLYFVLLSNFVINLTTHIVIKALYKKYYGKINIKENKDYAIAKDCKHLTVNTIANLIASNIDILLISKFIGLGSVVIYTAYNYITDNIHKMIDSLVGATMSSITRVIYNNKQKAYEILMEYSALVFYIAIILCVPIYKVINSFISIWYNGEVATSGILSALFTAILFYNIIKMPIKTFTFAAGEFKLIKKFVIFEILVNLIASLLLIKYFNIAGVLIATLFSYITCDYFPKSIAILKKLTIGSKKRYYSKHFWFICILILNILATNLVPYIPKDIASWLLYSVVIFLVNAILTTAGFWLSHDLAFMKRIKMLFNSRNN